MTDEKYEAFKEWLIKNKMGFKNNIPFKIVFSNFETEYEQGYFSWEEKQILLTVIEEHCHGCVFLNKRPDEQLYCEKNVAFTIDNLKGKICRFKK